MKSKLLKNLYDCFYVLPEFSERKREIEKCHQMLIKVLDKPERRLVLKIIDAEERVTEDISVDSFISGFKLAWQFSAELNYYESEHLFACRRAERASASFAF